MIGALRSMGLAARYVSGYLRSGTNTSARKPPTPGCRSSSRAAAGSIWIRPTTCGPSTGHITVAWGRDYGDVAPVKGIALGGGKQVVEVEVRVDPV